jgi:hypothetical protein
MKLATCNDLKVTWLVTVQVGVANPTARGRGSCDTVRWLDIPITRTGFRSGFPLLILSPNPAGPGLTPLKPGPTRTVMQPSHKSIDQDVRLEEAYRVILKGLLRFY